MTKDITLPEGLKLSADHAAYFRDDETLAIADLHLGYEASLQAEHVAIPRFQLEPMLKRIERLLERYHPERIVINGDMKHEFSRNFGQEWDEVENVLDALEGVPEIIVVRGNHDNFLVNMLARRDIELVEHYELPSGIFSFIHGHKPFPAEGISVFAHEHPVVRFVDEVGAMISLPCFLHDPGNRYMLMPAFSPLASGTNVLSPEECYMNPALKEMNTNDARVYAIHERVLWDFGRVEDLRRLKEEQQHLKELVRR